MLIKMIYKCKNMRERHFILTWRGNKKMKQNPNSPIFTNRLFFMQNPLRTSPELQAKYQSGSKLSLNLSISILQSEFHDMHIALFGNHHHFTPGILHHFTPWYPASFHSLVSCIIPVPASFHSLVSCIVPLSDILHHSTP